MIALRTGWCTCAGRRTTDKRTRARTGRADGRTDKGGARGAGVAADGQRTWMGWQRVLTRSTGKRMRSAATRTAATDERAREAEGGQERRVRLLICWRLMLCSLGDVPLKCCCGLPAGGLVLSRVGVDATLSGTEGSEECGRGRGREADAGNGRGLCAAHGGRDV